MVHSVNHFICTHSIGYYIYITHTFQFFIHDPHPSDGSTDGDSKDESKIWFQGRFFPSLGTTTTTPNNNNARRDRDSPTSVFNELSSTGTVTNATNNNMIMNATTTNSWGLLATQNTIIDECLTCSEGGYRELDLTFIRQKPVAKPRTFYRMSGSSRNNDNNSNDNDNDIMGNKKKKKKKKVRWVANDVIWTGGNMMTLSSDPYSANNTYNNSGVSMSMNEPGVKFDPQTLMEGKKAMAVAEKYFPSMVKRLRIHNALVNTNNDFFGGEDNSEEIGTTGVAGVICGEDNDAMVLIGDMEVVAPMSFVRMGNNNDKVRFASASGRNDSDDDDDDSDEDGLWND